MPQRLHTLGGAPHRQGAEASPDRRHWRGQSVTAWPRALSGPVMNMARPSRPRSEAALVRDAAATIKAETGLRSARAISREIARRVTSTMMDEVQADELVAIIVSI